MYILNMVIPDAPCFHVKLVINDTLIIAVSMSIMWTINSTFFDIFYIQKKMRFYNGDFDKLRIAGTKKPNAFTY